MRILVADDNEANREFLIEALGGHGHSVTGVCDGRAALVALEEEHFEVVLMDEEMPVMNGIEATRAIHQRKVPGGKRPVIIGLSGNSTDGDKKRCLAAGMDAFLPKPIGIGQLVKIIDLCGRSSDSAPPAQQIPPLAEPPSENVAAHLQRATSGNQKILRSLVKTFLTDTSKRLSALHRAVARSDAKQIAAIAHSLKGSLGLLGARKAAAIALSLKTTGSSGNLGGAAAEFRALQDEFRVLRLELRALQKKAKSPSKRTAKRRRPASGSRKKR